MALIATEYKTSMGIDVKTIQQNEAADNKKEYKRRKQKVDTWSYCWRFSSSFKTYNRENKIGF